ncbi:MAG: phytanoyl-CoA dioxygenase family protein [Spirochaetaceae bacterium]|nr:phytanoyl-CoA dioxygenase family protein [Spirochaetaceae bacterium]
MDTRNTNERSELAGARRADADWAALTVGERVRCLELEGYLVLPDLLDAEQISAIGAELAALRLTATDYSPHKQTADDLLGRDMPHTMAAIALPPTVAFLERLFGDDVLCTSISYQLCEPGHPGIAIHTDALPYGSRASGGLSSPVLIRALYYLDDLTPECSPFKVVPRSHLSVHADGNPYNRFLRHDEEVMVTCPAGSAVAINQKVFHGNYPNYSTADRRMLAISYRPAWAGPVTEVAPWAPERLAKLPPAARRLFRDPNTRRIDLAVQNRPADLDGAGAGISPSRWTAST